MLAGKSAFDVEEMTDEEAVSEALSALKQVWGDNVDEPLSY